MVFHRLVQKHQHFEAYCRGSTQKYGLRPRKNSKIFQLITRPKKIRRPKIWNVIDREPFVVFIQKPDKAEQ